METIIIKALLGLIIVTTSIFLSAKALKFTESKKLFMFNKEGSIKVIDRLNIDQNLKFLEVENKNKRYLLVINNTNTLLLDTYEKE